MSTAFTHAVVALSAGRIAFAGRMPLRFWVLSMACSAGPDLDLVGHAFGAGFDDPWGHRGMTHSLAFAAVTGFLVATIFFRRAAPVGSPRWWGFAAYFSAVTASHGLLDGLTDVGHGIAYLAPFDHTRYLFPWQPLPRPFIGLPTLFTARGVQIVFGEMLLVWLPALFLAVLVTGVRRWGRRPATDGGTESRDPDERAEP